MAKGSNYRSAGSGKFISAKQAAGNTGGSLKEPRTKSGDSPGSPYRSAVSGRYVTEKYGKANPGKVVRER